MADRQVHGHELTVKRGVLCLGQHQLVGPELKGEPLSVCLLFQDGTNTIVACVHVEADRCILHQESQSSGLLQGGLGEVEGVVVLSGPLKGELGGRQVCQRLCQVCQAWDECSVVVDQS